MIYQVGADIGSTAAKATYVITFESTHAAMAATKALATAGEEFLTIPVPSVISAGCGMAVKFEALDPEPVLMCVFGADRNEARGALYRQVDAVTYEQKPLR